MIHFGSIELTRLAGAAVAWPALASPACGQVVGEPVTDPSGPRRNSLSQKDR